jgi:hypothetical protein
MARQAIRRVDVYSELFPASSAVVIGLGVVAIAMGSAVSGAAFILAGIGVGIAGAMAKAPVKRKLRRVR